MHPEIERQLAAERVKELRRAGAVARLRAATPRRAEVQQDIVIREARNQDHLAVAALAVLDGAEQPLGRTIVAEVNGSIVAALPLDDGAGPFADPFRRTSDLVALLEARAKQIESERGRGHRSRFAWLSATALRRLV
jgi:hypothetical protein